MDESQRQLIRRAIHGDDRAFHELLEQHAGQLFGIAYRMLGNAPDAEDAVQETFLAAYRGISHFQQRSSLRSWLIGILAKQVALVYRRRKAKQTSAIAEDLPDRGGAGAGRSDARLDVAQMLQELAPEYREILVLREYEQMTYEQIAQALGIPPGTVESRLYRARQQLKEKLSDYQ